MMLATASLRFAHTNTYLTRRAVPGAVTHQSLDEVMTILVQDLQQKSGSAPPCIYLCELNPHAGESGHISREEIEVITLGLDTLNAKGYNLVGLLPAETLFQPKYLQLADAAVLAMCYNQGLPALKYQGFDRAGNITLGLPFIRTSVDYGTAMALAGSGQAETDTIKTALNLTST